MKFGFVGSIQRQTGRSGRETLQLTNRLCRAASDYGFDSIWKGQHFLTDLVNFQPVPLLARLSGEVPGMTLGSCTILPLEHPVRAAEYGANVDILTGGQYVFGAVLGYRDVEFDSLDVPKGERVGRMIEGVEALRRLWSGDSVSFDGTYYSFDNVTINPKPVQDGGPPIWIGANADEAIERAARIGDAWLINPHATIEAIQSQCALYEDALRECGTDPSDVTVPLRREALIAEDEETAIEAARPHLETKYRKYVDWGQSDAMGDSGDLDREFRELAEDRFVIGTPEQAVEQIERYRAELDVDHLNLKMYWPGMNEETSIQSIRLFGEEVIPHFE